MQFAIEKVAHARNELEPLIYAQWLEVENNQDRIKLNPDWEVYSFLETHNLLRLYTARDKNKLVGYFCVTMGVSLHHKDHKFAISDVIYLKPESRNGMTAYKLISYAEKNLNEIGVSVLTVNTKVKKPFDKLLDRMGFKLDEKQYTKYIGD